jgi:DNA-binding transcriptional LysR family regulator
MKPSPYQISAFTHAARERGFSKAAKVMGVTQSSVTQHVAKLERVMGTQLFIRRREGLELTRAGRELFEISDRLRTLEQLIEEKVGDYGDLSTGQLTIVANAPRPALPIMARYLALYPNVEIDFTLVSWELALRRLIDREVDIAIMVEPEARDGLTVLDIGPTRYRAYVNRGHPLAGRGTISIADLAEETVILPEDGSLTQRLAIEAADAMGIRLGRVLKTSTFAMVKEAVLHGAGIGLMLEDGQFPSQNLVSLRVSEIDRPFRNCLVTPSDKADLRLVRSFREVTLDVVERR